MDQSWLIGIGIGAGGLALTAVGGRSWIRGNLNTAARQGDALRDAGYEEKTASIRGGEISYLEGPAHGPPLLLIHGQLVDKFNYAPALPALAASFHVFAVDCYGHGRSSHDPARYTNRVHGQDHLSFIKDVIREPALVSGHSSGGIISAWLAAHADGWVKGVLFEDPPFLTLDLPRARTTWNWYDLASTAHDFLRSGETDWVLYQAERSRFWELFGRAGDFFRKQAMAYRARHPNEPIQLAIMPATLNELWRTVPSYDPRFGEAFYTASWNDGFDITSTLAAIEIPTTYQRSHADLSPNGILLGATSQVEADQARALLRDVEYAEDTQRHSWHWSDPQDFVRKLHKLRQRAGM